MRSSSACWTRSSSAARQFLFGLHWSAALTSPIHFPCPRAQVIPLERSDTEHLVYKIKNPESAKHDGVIAAATMTGDFNSEHESGLCIILRLLARFVDFSHKRCHRNCVFIRTFMSQYSKQHFICTDVVHGLQSCKHHRQLGQQSSRSGLGPCDAGNQSSVTSECLAHRKCLKHAPAGVVCSYCASVQNAVRVILFSTRHQSTPNVTCTNGFYPTLIAAVADDPAANTHFPLGLRQLAAVPSLPGVALAAAQHLFSLRSSSCDCHSIVRVAQWSGFA